MGISSKNRASSKTEHQRYRNCTGFPPDSSHVHRLCQSETSTIRTQTSLFPHDLTRTRLSCTATLWWSFSITIAAPKPTMLLVASDMIAPSPISFHNLRSHGFALSCNATLVNALTSASTPTAASTMRARPTSRLRTDCSLPPSPMVILYFPARGLIWR